MDAPPPYPGFEPVGSGGWQVPASAPPPYSVNDPGSGNPNLQQGGGNVMVVCGGWDGDRQSGSKNFLQQKLYPIPIIITIKS